MNFINIHSHKKASNKNITLINLFPNEIENLEEGNIYSVGIHPWEVSKINVEEQLAIIEDIIAKKNILAIGEIGLDKYRDNFELQKETFLNQINIAQSASKPIIVHCVKAYSELLEIIKKERLKIPIIIHRYSGNKTIAKELIKFGCYLSFGHELFNSKSKAPRVFKTLPLKNIFLETDDANINIEDVYKRASEIKGLDILTLEKAIKNNFENIFIK